MCLSNIKQQHISDEIKSGWKIFIKQGKKRLGSLYCSLSIYDPGVWNLAVLSALRDKSGREYLSGFHIYEFETEARRVLEVLRENYAKRFKRRVCPYVLRKVEYRHEICRGFENYWNNNPELIGEESVIVALSMRIPSESTE